MIDDAFGEKFRRPDLRTVMLPRPTFDIGSNQANRENVGNSR
jgi:hypothetical protein